MRIKYLLSYILLFAVTPSFSQEEIWWRNAIYLELWGNGEGLTSLNYERVLFVNRANSFLLSARVGYTYQTDRFEHKPINGFPSEGIFTYQLAKHHYLELGAGFTPYWSNNNYNDTAVPPNLRSGYFYNMAFRIGYKYVGDDGFYFKSAPVGIIENDLPGGIYGVNYKLVFGITLGIAF